MLTTDRAPQGWRGASSMTPPWRSMPGMGHIEDWSVIRGTELFEDLGPGKTETKTLKLTPGFYVASCYMLSKAADGTSFIHRDKGQRIVFVVK